MIIRETITIAAPPEVVWRVFADMENWRQWNRVCRNCRYESGSAMAVDACFSFRITPLFFPLRVTPKIVHCRPAREIVWQGGRLGVHAEHLFQFEPRNGGTRLVSEEHFTGVLLPLMVLAGIPRRLHRLTTAFLKALKNAAETCCEKP